MYQTKNIMYKIIMDSVLSAQQIKKLIFRIVTAQFQLIEKCTGSQNTLNYIKET